MFGWFGKDKEKQDSGLVTRFYSDEVLDRYRREKIRAIAIPADITEMTTGDLLYFTDGTNPDSAIRLEARRNAETGGWDIRQVVTFELAGETSPDLNHKQQYRNIGAARYDFDALRYLSQESAARETGKKEGRAGHKDMKHWRAAAKAAGQPVDDRGVIQPLSGGQLLADNVFFDDPEQIRLVEENRPKIITPPTIIAAPPPKIELKLEKPRGWLRSIFSGSGNLPQPLYPAGQAIIGKGIYLGVWKSRDREGRVLGKIFDIYAAPYDLGIDANGKGSRQVDTYNNAVKAVGRIKDLMCHDGAKYRNDTELYEALQNGAYKGEWFIPPRDILCGEHKDGNKVQKDNLYDHRNEGRFNNTFITECGSGSADSYWSCTAHPDGSPYVFRVDFTLFGGGNWYDTDGFRLSARLIRAEPRL